MAYQDLIIFCLYSTASRKEGCRFEDLVGECYNQFPDKFCFAEYPQWPDARKFDRALRSLRSEGQIKGSPQSSFSLTRAGLKRAQQLDKLLRQNKLF